MQNSVAVIVRTKDRPRFLERALANIAAQTYPQVKTVVVNDGGDAATVDRLIEASALSKVQVIHHEVSRGMEAASNVGIRACASEFIAIHDDDDLWEPTFLEKTVAALEENDDVMVVVRTDEYFEKITPSGFEFIESRPFWGNLQGMNVIDFFRINRAVPIGILYRRRLLDELGYYNENLPVVGDWEFNVRVASKHKVLFLQENLAHWSKRLNATGPDSNSVYAAAQEHKFFDARVRSDAVREHLAQGGHLGPYLYNAHLANEVQEAVHHSHALLLDVLNRLERIEATQREQAARLERVERALSVRGRVRTISAKLQRLAQRREK